MKPARAAKTRAVAMNMLEINQMENVCDLCVFDFPTKKCLYLNTIWDVKAVLNNIYNLILTSSTLSIAEMMIHGSAKVT